MWIPQDKVQLVGRVDKVEDWLSRAGLFVQSSRIEGFPNALLEAMGMGLAVISTNCRSGPSEIIEDGVNGRLVPTESVLELADTMIELDWRFKQEASSWKICFGGQQILWRGKNPPKMEGFTPFGKKKFCRLEKSEHSFFSWLNGGGWCGTGGFRFV